MRCAGWATASAADPMHAVPVTPADIPAWLTLAAQFESLFGPMVENPAFLTALDKTIAQGRAFCVRADDGPPGAPLLGGILLGSHPPRYEIDWLAVEQQSRRQGVGHVLLSHVLSLIEPPAEVMLLTFAAGIEDGEAARRLYERHGFQPAEPGPTNPAGYATQVFRLTLGHTPTVRAVIEDNGRYLLVLHNFLMKEHIGEWSLPGGRVDPTDPDHVVTLRRELREEFGIEVDILRFLDVYPYHTRLHYVYHVRPHSTELVIDEKEILGHAWLTVDEVAALDAAGKMHTGFELPAILASRQRSSRPARQPGSSI